MMEEKQPESARLEAEYLDFLADSYRYLDFQGAGSSDPIPWRLPLLEMYIPLQARVGTSQGEPWMRELRLAGRALSEEETQVMGQRIGAPQPLLQLLKDHPGLVVLGDPGAGKTTFLKFLALSLATGQGQPPGLDQRLPVFLPLSAYAAALSGRKPDTALDRFMSQYYQGVQLFPIDTLLEQVLAKGGALLLLDGLDEVKDPEQRHRVMERVTDFFSVHRRTGNRLVLTSRTAGYAEVRPRPLEGLAECTLADFEDGQIEAFVGRWTAALEGAARGQSSVTASKAARQPDELLSAIRHNSGVRALAVKPLLLTLLASLKGQGIELPERRVELYRNYLETLLERWNLARRLAGRAGRDLDLIETVRILAPLALWMHRTSPGVGLVPRGKLQCELEEIYRARRHRDPEKAAREFLDDMRDHAGLLLDRGGDQFGFIHLTFQEYLAAVALAQKGRQDIAPIVAELAAQIGDATWHQVSLLAVGYLGLVQQRDEAAGAVLEKLIEWSPGEPGQAVILAGEAVADSDGGATPASRQRVVEALLRTLGDHRRVTAKRRAAAGRVLAACGDPRPAVMTLDGMEFCRVPAGPFLLGSADDPDIVEEEKPQQEYNIPYDYWIARYPVTVAQFRLYSEASGAQPSAPEALQDPANHPVRWVSWPEALAFCRWLTRRWRERGLLPARWKVVLPSEPEWEKAAKGGLQIPVPALVGPLELTRREIRLRRNPRPARRYPWGDEPNPNRANYAATDLDSSSAMGCFLKGVSPYGCEEMGGNVWEWTRSLWGEDWSTPQFGYPYEPADGRENLNAPDTLRRVVRGGAFHNDSWYVRCAYRDCGPAVLDYDAGFRVVVSPFLSGR